MTSIRRNDYFNMTNAILVVLFVVFLVETFMGGSENTTVLYKMGAMYNPLVAIKHQFWRLFTAQFLHIGILHIASNAIIILYLGRMMEPFMGSWRFLALYLLSGIGGNLMSFAFGSDLALSAGASTALFGLLGALTTLLVTSDRRLATGYADRQALSLAVLNIVIDLFISEIDIWGHVGGFITGFCLMSLITTQYRGLYQRTFKILSAIGIVVYVIVTLRLGMRINF